jgi:hypothetical protein
MFWIMDQLLALDTVGCTMVQGAVFVLHGGCFRGRLLQKYGVGWFLLSDNGL